jgi:DNA-binding MarR family transcriptional regulator
LSQPPDTAADVWALMQTFVDRNSPRHELRRRLGMGLAKGRGKVMTLMRLGGGPLSLGEIADAQGIDRPYATAIVDQLELLGLAERTADPDDRRRKLVALTVAGQEAVEIAAEIMAEPPVAFGDLSRAELAQLGALLTRLTPTD